MNNSTQKSYLNVFMALVTAVLLSVTVTGCGDGQKDFVFTNTGVPPAPVVGTGNLTFNFVQAQGVITVPLGTTTLDFTFYDGPSQSGNITKTDSQAYASSVTVVDVPSNTQSYRIVALNANGAPLATATGSVTVVVGQTITVDVTGVTVTLTLPTNTPLNVLVSNNGTGNAGDLDLFNHKSREVLDAKLGELMEGGYRALVELREQGVIRAFGAGVAVASAAAPRRVTGVGRAAMCAAARHGDRGRRTRSCRPRGRPIRAPPARPPRWRQPAWAGCTPCCTACPSRGRARAGTAAPGWSCRSRSPRSRLSQQRSSQSRLRTYGLREPQARVG